MTLRSAVVRCMRPGWNQRVRITPLFNLLFLLIVLVGEFFLPLWIDWDLPVSKSSGDDEVRLLVVADPHVQLYHPYWYYAEYFSLLDSDRYLRRYFRRVHRLAEPDAILILGDLVDGEMDAPNVAFYHAIERLKQLFISSHALPCFVIPGDNDVGGDWNDPMSTERCERFKGAFGHLSFPKRIKFAKLYGYVPWPEHNDLSFTDTSDVVIFLSHHPIITPYGAGFPETMIHLKPAVLISGHDHVAYILRWEHKLGMSAKINWIVPPDARQLPVGSFQLQLDGVLEQSNVGNLVQLGVPSCSYRSGQSSLAAYGLVQIFRNRTMKYTLLPLPDRLPVIYLYIFMLVILLGYTFLCLPFRKTWITILCNCGVFMCTYFFTQLLD